MVTNVHEKSSYNPLRINKALGSRKFDNKKKKKKKKKHKNMKSKNNVRSDWGPPSGSNN